MNNSELIEEYKKFISFEKRLSPSSVKNYLRDIDTLLKLNENTTLDAIQSKILERILPHCIQKVWVENHYQE